MTIGTFLAIRIVPIVCAVNPALPLGARIGDGDVCNIAAGVSCDANGNVVPDECECEDHDACTFDHFVVGVCELTPVAYGDINGTGVVDVDDIVCTLNGFVNRCNCPTADIDPCTGNGIIDVDDIVASLDAFVGNAHCDCGG